MLFDESDFKILSSRLRRISDLQGKYSDMTRSLAPQQPVGNVSAAGFTLVELMIVIALLGIAATIAVPAFQDFINSLNLRVAARGVASDIFLVRGQAVSENRAYRMTFDRSDNAYRVYKRNKDDSDWEGPCLTRSLSSFGNGVVFGFEDMKSINFQTRGTVSADTITLSNKKSDASITINFAGRSYVTLHPE